MECKNLSIHSTVSWKELNGIIYLTIVFNEVFNETWIDRLGKLIPGKKFFLIQERAKGILLSPDFRIDEPAIYEIAILKNLVDGAFDAKPLCTKDIIDKAALLGFKLPSSELACIVREKISHEDLLAMGIESLVFMHEPINDSKGKPSLLYLNRGNHYDGEYHDMLGAVDYEAHGTWFACANFAFLVSKTYL